MSNEYDDSKAETEVLDSHSNSRDAAPQIGNTQCVCEAGITSGRPRYVYAIGSVHVRSPNISVEKEYRQVVKEEQIERLTDRQVVYQTLKNNRYLAREFCWILNIEGIDAYILVPREPNDLDQLVESIAPQGRENLDTDIAVGERGPIAPFEQCGLELPILVLDRLYMFKKKDLIENIPRPEGIDEEQFLTVSDDLFNRVQQSADNVGASDEHRAINYLAVRDAAIYERVYMMYRKQFTLESIEAKKSRLSEADPSRRNIDVILTFVERKTTATEKYYTRVDVSGKWPFVTKALDQFFDRV